MGPGILSSGFPSRRRQNRRRFNDLITKAESVLSPPAPGSRGYVSGLSLWSLKMGDEIMEMQACSVGAARWSNQQRLQNIMKHRGPVASVKRGKRYPNSVHGQVRGEIPHGIKSEVTKKNALYYKEPNPFRQSDIILCRNISVCIIFTHDGHITNDQCGY